MSKNIKGVTDCFGCGICAVSCPKNIISIELNKNGFYEPRINDDSHCINCGICLDVCSFNNIDISRPEFISLPKSWAAWSNEINTRMKCSSGGVGFEIGKQLIEKGYKALGCRYNINKQRAEHFIASSVEEFVESKGSKYIQSYTVDAFSHIDRTKKYVIFGTPCQIDSLRRMLKRYKCEDSFLLVDFFCHGVPSMLGWKYYLAQLPNDLGCIKSIEWRSKDDCEWHDSYRIKIVGENKSIISDRKSGDLFYSFFLDDLCVGKQCVNKCKYKMNNSAADVRIGDFWGKTYFSDKLGVNAIISFTSKGIDVVENLKNVTLIEHPVDVVCEGQMEANVSPNPLCKYVMNQLRKGKSINNITLFAAGFIKRNKNRMTRYLNRIK